MSNASLEDKRNKRERKNKKEKKYSKTHSARNLNEAGSAEEKKYSKSHSARHLNETATGDGDGDDDDDIMNRGKQRQPLAGLRKRLPGQRRNQRGDDESSEQYEDENARGRKREDENTNHDESESSQSEDVEADGATPVKSNRSGRGRSTEQPDEDSSNKASNDNNNANTNSNNNSKRGRDGPTIGKAFQKLRERSRSRSRSRNRSKIKDGNNDVDGNGRKDMLVAVTSCRSDGYYNQKSPGSIAKLPRKAPTNLKLFHELAVGVKDAYAAVGETPQKPDEADSDNDETTFEARSVLWEFVGNLDFLLALVDEVAVDTVTRGALKEDQTFKGVRDVIKKCNRILEDMLVRRERKYTLFFRLVQSRDKMEIERMKAWNEKVERAVGSVTSDGRRHPGGGNGTDTESESDMSDASSSDSSSVGSRAAGVFSRGRQLLPAAGRVRSRRATPTPRLRKHRSQKSLNGDGDENDTVAGDDGFSNKMAKPMSAEHQKGSVSLPNGLALKSTTANAQNKLNEAQQMEPKDELVDVIRGLRVEKKQRLEGATDNDLQALKPNWLPKADIPASVPKLPIEYVHRHRLMKQVVSCLLDQSGAGPRDTDDENAHNTIITSVTSRHSDKAGNGKTTLAVAAIQTVEVRERFPDGIAWLKLGSGPLSDKDIRRLYGELYRQLVGKTTDIDDFSDDESSNDNTSENRDEMTSRGARGQNPNLIDAQKDYFVERADSMRRFQGGDLEGIKEDLARMLSRRKVLICLDDVSRVEDARWFIFDMPTATSSPRTSVISKNGEEDSHPYRILMTTRIPSLMGAGIVQEVFVRILSEHEAVKLLLSTAGRRPYGGRNSAVFNQARMIVKGCGNSPLAIRLVGSMLRMGNRNWNLRSPIWTSLISQCTLNLEEASILRSFVNAFTRIVDLSFFTVEDGKLRIALRRCFVWFAMSFHDNDWMLAGRGLPESIILRAFTCIIATMGSDRKGGFKDPQSIAATTLAMLENMNLLQRAGHGVSRSTKPVRGDSPSVSSNDREGESERSGSDWSDLDEGSKTRIQHFFVVLDSLKAVAEKMADRDNPSFSPKNDQFTHFSNKIEEELSIGGHIENSWSKPLRYLLKSVPAPNGESEINIQEEKASELMILAVLGMGDGKALSKSLMTEALQSSQIATQMLAGGDKLEEYTMSFLPEHLMRAKSYESVAEMLSSAHFVRRRVFSLGIMEATVKQVADLLELRRVVGKYTSDKGSKRFGHDAPKKGRSANPEELFSFDIDTVVCDGSRVIIDEIYKVTNSMGSSDSLGMATCLAAVGEGLLKSRQPRDAMLRLEEAVSLYRGILGPYHVYVAHALNSVAKALVKLGETRVALLKFAEAARIYEACNATLHYDSIGNAQSLAALLVDIGDMDKADSMFEEVIAMKMSVYGEQSIPVAKTINSYAILLAKHGRMNQAMGNYEAAKATYEMSPPPLIYDAEFEIKCNYDVTLITLNIASIWSKNGDLKRALECYEEGVEGLQKYEEAMKMLHEGKAESEATKTSSHKHMIAALGRIGSIKLKLGDEQGALVAYLRLLNEVNDDSPMASQTEKAKAQIKCATIYRQRDDSQSAEKSIEHLREALRMYKAIFGSEHKDTLAIKASLDQWLAEDRNK